MMLIIMLGEIDSRNVKRFRRDPISHCKAFKRWSGSHSMV